MNRIEQRFNELQQSGRKGLVIYIGAGDPDLQATHDLALAFNKVGVDILELGIPFSDPLADGLVNQLAAQRGLASGTTPTKVLDTVSKVRQQCPIPIVLYIYYNLIHRIGMKPFLTAAANAGVDGLLVLDLPPEEADTYEQEMDAVGLCPIWLIAPTTPPERIARIVPRAKGFIYYVSREGVTGMQSAISGTIPERIAEIRRATALPVAIGFGISNPEQARQVAQHAEAIVVGSAVVDRIARLGSSNDLVPEVSGFVESLRMALDESQS